jgi:hypothetical protein
MPYKDRATYLRKQKEFYRRRKAARVGEPARQVSYKGEVRTGVDGVKTLTPLNSEPKAPVPSPSLLSLLDLVKKTTIQKAKISLDSNVMEKKISVTPRIQPLPAHPLGVIVNCPYCLDSGYSSPGTRCAYCSPKLVLRSTPRGPAIVRTLGGYLIRRK